jgi:hypothetical protein
MFYWSQSNPHWVTPSSHQDKRKINVWAGIIGTKIIGPFFIDNILNGENYLELLQSQIRPQILENEITEEIWFQQDGAPPHYDIRVREFLDMTFPGHWIGRRGPIEWPARSPDLSPLDFFLWGYLKLKIYKSRSQTVDELKEKIINECQNISSEVLEKVMEETYHRFSHCLVVQGSSFEHLLK